MSVTDLDHQVPPAEHEDLLRFVAQLYYRHDRTQSQIATLLGFSVSKVSRLLSEARHRGIVEIRIVERAAGETELEAQLRERFKLRSVHVVPAQVRTRREAGEVIGLAAADLLPRTFRGDECIGLCGGYTVYHLILNLEPAPGGSYTFVPLLGAWVTGAAHLQLNDACRMAAERLGGRALALPAPMLLDHVTTRQALLSESSIRQVTDLWGRLDVAVVGIGGPPSEDPGYQTVPGMVPADVRAALDRLGVIGDLGGHFFDRHGRIIKHQLSERTLIIPVEALRRVPRVIALAGGLSKAGSILGALRTGLVHELVTDRLTAERMLAISREQAPEGAVAG